MSKNKVLIAGNIAGLISFFVITLSVGEKWKLQCGHCSKTYGFPFDAVTYGVFSNNADILWLGLFANTLVAIFFSLAVGTIFRLVLLKLSAGKLK